MDRETEFYQIVGVEFDASGAFEIKEFNQDGEYWYAEAYCLHAIIRETASDNTMMELVFHGKHVDNYGEADQSINEEHDVQGAVPAYLLYQPNYSINWEHSYVYSCPYGFMMMGDIDDSIYLNLHVYPHNFEGFYEEGSRTEQEVKEWTGEGAETDETVVE